MIYPGRVIIIGRDPSGRHDVVVYAVTGRSPSSRARRLVHDGGGSVRTEVTDPDLLPGGNEKLLIYHCLRPYPGGLAVSNGAQTDLIRETALSMAEVQAASPGEKILQNRPPADPAEEGRHLVPFPVRILMRAMERPYLVSGIDVTAYEPDAPAYTPRISGCLASDAALAIVRRLPGGDSGRQYYAVPLIPGQGRLLATYDGENRDPLPPFEGDPREVVLAGKSPQMVAESVFQALGPRGGAARAADRNNGPDRATTPSDGDPDLRVGVAALFRDWDTGRLEAAIINRTEGGS